MIARGVPTASFIRDAIARGDCDSVSMARPPANTIREAPAAGHDRAPPCTYCNKCLARVEHPIGCGGEPLRQLRRDAGRDHVGVLPPADTCSCAEGL